MSQKSLTKRNSFTTNMFIVSAIVVAGVAGYLMLTKNAASDQGQIIPSGNTNNGGGTPVVVKPPTCQGRADEFPLKVGAGFSGRPNQLCEGEYVKNVQRYLNYYTSLGYGSLTVDGKLGEKTLSAYKARFDSYLATYSEISLSAYQNIIKELPTL